MTDRERFIIGGVGGLAPVLMFLATGDFHRYFGNEFVGFAVGYCARALILFFIGGFVVCLYREETLRIKAFQLGLGAPAMIAGFLAATSNPPVPFSLKPNNSTGTVLVAVLAAQEGSNDSDVKRFTLPEPTAWDQFFGGLTGYRPKNVWFVIAGSFLSVDNAKVCARKINDTFPGFHADAYAPYGDNPYYACVIGAHLTQNEAKILRDKAVNAGLDRQTYYKTFPNLPLP
jgi:hypothetical protein